MFGKLFVADDISRCHFHKHIFLAFECKTEMNIRHGKMRGYMNYKIIYIINKYALIVLFIQSVFAFSKHLTSYHES